MTKKPKLTVKEAKLVKAKAQGLTNAKAYVEAGYSANSKEVAEANARKVLARRNVQDALYAEFEKQGITLEAIVKPIKEGLTASKTVVIRDKAATPEEAANSAFADEVPDHSIRLKASGMAAGFLGIGKVTEGGTTNNFVQINNHLKDKYSE